MWPLELQDTRLPCPSPSSGVCSNWLHWVSDVIQPSHPLSPPSPPVLNLFQHQGLFQWVGSSHQMAKVLKLHHQSFQWIFRVVFLWDWLVWSSFCPRDTQECSLAPQFKSVNSSVLSLLYGPTLTSIHDYWENHSFDWRDRCWQSDVSAFQYTNFVIAGAPETWYFWIVLENIQS